MIVRRSDKERRVHAKVQVYKEMQRGFNRKVGTDSTLFGKFVKKKKVGEKLSKNG